MLLTYCHDVLQQYFAVTTWPEAAPQPALFSTLQQQVRLHLPANSKVNSAAPKPYGARVRADISYPEFLKLCQQRCSTRNFLAKPVEQSILEQAVSAAAQAPSACNRQPFRYIAALSLAMLGKLAALPMGTVGYAHNIPAILAVVGDLSAYPLERDRHVIYIDASLANMQLMLALETLGLASCAINWPDIENYELKIGQLLALKPFERVVMLIAVGYQDPDGLVPHSEKKTPAEQFNMSKPLLIEVKRVQFRNKGAYLMLLATLQGLQTLGLSFQLVLSPGPNLPYLERAKLGAWQKLSFRRYNFDLTPWFGKLPNALRQFARRYGLVTEADVDVVLEAIGFAYGDQWPLQFLQNTAREVVRYHKAGKPFIFMPQAFGPLTPPPAKAAMVDFIQHATAIFVRDAVIT
ncbi:MAG: nitroreductase family protein [Rheinheimera sp.]|nr:nitroreductase family protein [Rheinheimera sp.]